MRSFKYLPAALSLFSAGVWADPDPDKDVWVVVTKTNTVTVCPITHWDTCDNWPTFPPNPTTSQPPNQVTTTKSWSWTSTPSSSRTSTTTQSGSVVSTSSTSSTSTSYHVGPIYGSTTSTSSTSTGSTSTSSVTTGSTSTTASGSTSSTTSGSTSSTTSRSTSITSSLSTSTTSESTTSSTTTSSSYSGPTTCTSGLQTGTSQCYNVQCGYFANGGAGSSQNKNVGSVGECIAYCVSINAPLGCNYSYGTCLVYADAPVSTGNADDTVDFAYIQPVSCGSTTTTTTTGTESTSSTSSASTSTTSESTSQSTTTTSSDGGSTTTSSSTSTTTTSSGGPGFHYPEGFFFLSFYTPGSRKMAKRSTYYFAFDNEGYSEVVTSQSDAAVFTISNGYLFDQDSESYVGIFGNQLGFHVSQADAVTVQVGDNGTVTIPGAANFCYVSSSLFFDISSYEGSTCEPLILGVASDPNPPATTTSSSTTTGSTSVSTSTSTVTVSVTSSTTTSAYGYANGTTTTSDPYSTTTTSSYLGYNGTTTTTTTSGIGYNATTTTTAYYNGTTTTSAYTTTTALNTTSTCNNTTHTATSLPDVCNAPGSRSTWCDGMSVGSDTLQPYLTGQTKYFTLTITNTTAGWDGLTTFDFAINGQNPGPLIELNWGDVAVVTVINQLQDNATTIHWHGVRQFGTNDQDGVPGITECGIAPGSQRTYTWLASTYGTSWYHSHTLSQFGGGIRGPIIVHGPTTADYDLDLGQIMIEDVYNGPFMAVAALAARTVGAPPIAINYLLNGKNLGPDGVSGANPKWILQAGKKHLIRIINSSAQGSYIVHLDGHTFTVVSADFTPIVPYQTQNLYIQAGQRYMVVVEADQTPAAYFFRAITQAGCAVPNVNSGLGINNGIFEYETSCGTPPSNAFANSTLPFDLRECQDEDASNLVPYVSETAGDASQFAANVETLPAGNADAAFYAEYGLIIRWYFGGPGINGTNRLISNYTQPTLQTLSQVGAPYNSSIYSNAVVLDGPFNGWVYFVIQNPFRTSHPIHLHGHDFSVLGQGKGFFDSSMVGQLNFANPIRRDTALLYGTLANPSGWTVIGFQTNNPGAWLMHCHIIWHADGGMALQYIEHPDAINPDQYTSTSAFEDECSSLQTYEAQGAFRLPESFSSGIKRRHDFNAHAHIDSHIMHAAHRDVVRHI